MGEVYRADDLRLGQAVALKFLPVDLARDPVRLAQFHNEVRTARQVSHPNVCRVYDIGEIDGQLFLTMEYVDGEDLSLLLRRIGRLPEDKGLDIARQICAGLAAAHERGVLHRDLKPANIMLDGSGKVRVMDFSLAAVGEVKDIRAGTPAYMAPEQLSGQEVTIRSDIYALGLVLYEIFTGRRAFEAKTLSDLIEQHQAGAITAPTAIVKTLDPAIETAIVRCLEANPSRRPPSALGVSASLPGGDPLAAALAAGETPSPELVAAAGGDCATMTPASGAAWIALIITLLAATAGVFGRTSLLARIPAIKPVDVLEDRAETLRQSFGYGDRPADHVRDFTYDNAYLRWVETSGTGPAKWAGLSAGRPPALRFWYRTSPAPLLPFNVNASVSLTDPPLLLHGMTLVILDPEGRLQRFEAAPPEIEAPAPSPSPHVDWTPLFAAAGLDVTTFTGISPPRTPHAFADERKAWTGVVPGTSIPVTIDAAGYRGRPILFDIVPPWREPAREPAPAQSGSTSPVYIYVLLGGSALAAFRNVRRGRADRRGAARLAAFGCLVMSLVWILSPHVADAVVDQRRFFVGFGLALFIGAVLYFLYLGLEPFVRRSWPSMLVTWSRVLAGRLRDPLVGRDIAFGVACGAALSLVHAAADALPGRFGLTPPPPHTGELTALLGARPYMLTLVGSINAGLQNALFTVFVFAVFRAFFERATRRALRWIGRRWTWAGRLSMSDRAYDRLFLVLAVGAVTVLSLAGTGGATQRALDASIQALTTTVILLVLLRIGIFAAAIMFVVNNVLVRIPLTIDPSALYATPSWTTIAGLAALASLGVWWATAAARPGARGAAGT